ncbi:hypothetical protein J7E62_09310 [Variovorax paradoxus]|nr:hypothetical protein [Variovorax paradoxus]
MNTHPVESLNPPPAAEAQEPWVLLWSQSQNALHIEPISKMFASNLAAFNENRRMDYVPLFIGTIANVDRFAGEFHPIVDARTEARRQADGTYAFAMGAGR